MENRCQQRSIPLAIVFTLITCGIYGIYWYVCLTDESIITTRQEGTTGIMVLLFHIITCGIYSIYWGYKMGERLDFEKRQRGMYTSNNSGILYLILNIFGLDIITWSLVQNELNMLNSSQRLEYEYTDR